MRSPSFAMKSLLNQRELDYSGIAFPFFFLSFFFLFLFFVCSFFLFVFVFAFVCTFRLNKLIDLRKMQKPPAYGYFQFIQVAQREETVIGWKMYSVSKNWLSHILMLPVQKRNNFPAITKFWAIMEKEINKNMSWESNKITSRKFTNFAFK